MTNEQVKRYYYRFCRWQLSGPHYVNCHQDSVQHCHNCGTEFADNFCPRCGQRAEVGRVGWNSLKENIALLWGMDSRSLSFRERSPGFSLGESGDQQHRQVVQRQ